VEMIIPLLAGFSTQSSPIKGEESVVDKTFSIIYMKLSKPGFRVPAEKGKGGLHKVINEGLRFNFGSTLLYARNEKP